MIERIIFSKEAFTLSFFFLVGLTISFTIPNILRIVRHIIWCRKEKIRRIKSEDFFSSRSIHCFNRFVRRLIHRTLLILSLILLYSALYVFCLDNFAKGENNENSVSIDKYHDELINRIDNLESALIEYHHSYSEIQDSLESLKNYFDNSSGQPDSNNSNQSYSKPKYIGWIFLSFGFALLFVLIYYLWESERIKKIMKVAIPLSVSFGISLTALSINELRFNFRNEGCKKNCTEYNIIQGNCKDCTTGEIRTIYKVYPFITGTTTLVDTVNTLSLINTIKDKSSYIQSLYIIGGTDKREVNSHTKYQYKSNFNLATARAHVIDSLVHTIDNLNFETFVLCRGARYFGINKNKMANDRCVEIVAVYNR